jgi:hypothetical protein
MAQPNLASTPHDFLPGSPQTLKHILQGQVPTTLICPGSRHSYLDEGCYNPPTLKMSHHRL